MIDVFSQLLVSGLLIGGLYALITVGLTLVFGVLRVVNFAHGEYLTIAMYCTYFLFSQYAIDPFIASLLVVPFLFVLGILTERVLIRPTLNAPHVVQVFVTFALSLWIQNLLLVLFTSDFRSVRIAYATASMQVGSIYVSKMRLAAFVIAIGAAIGLTLFLKYSYLGNAIQATAQDRRSARLVGIDVDKVYAITFGLGCALVGVAGVLLTPLFPMNPYTGADMILIAFVIVVMGGLGSVSGAVLGGLTVGIIESFTGYFLGGEMKQFVYFVFFMLVLAVRPTGFFGKRGSEVMEVT